MPVRLQCLCCPLHIFNPLLGVCLLRKGSSHSLTLLLCHVVSASTFFYEVLATNRLWNCQRRWAQWKLLHLREIHNALAILILRWFLPSLASRCKMQGVIVVKTACKMQCKTNLICCVHFQNEICSANRSSMQHLATTNNFANLS